MRALRLFRHGRGQCENRWMDEPIKVAGPTVDFNDGGVGAGGATRELIGVRVQLIPWWRTAEASGFVGQ